MKNEILVIIPFALPWDWSADYERQTSLTLARTGYRVIAYIHEDARFFLKLRPHKIISSEKNIMFFQPRYLLPFRRFILIDELNQLLNIFYLYVRYGLLRKRKTILWIFNPIFWFYPLLTRPLQNLKSIYDNVDYAWGHGVKAAIKMQEKEKILVKFADYFFVNSHTLAGLHSKIRKPDAIVPQGFDLRDFKLNLKSKIQFPKNKPVIGYAGSVDYRIDFTLLKSIVKRNPQWNFVIWGPVWEGEKNKKIKIDIKALSNYPNVFFGKSVDKSQIPGVIKQFDIGIIPYDTSIVSCRYCYPTKLLEYFYMGKPVVSTPIEELKRFPRYVKIGRTAEEWEKIIKSLLSRPWPASYRRKQRQLALVNSWDKKIAAVSHSLGSGSDFSNNFKAFYTAHNSKTDNFAPDKLRLY